MAHQEEAERKKNVIGIELEIETILDKIMR